MSAFEISLIVSRVVSVALDLYLILIGLRALRAAPGSFRYNAGANLVMLGVGFLLTYADRVAPNASSAAVFVTTWSAVALVAIGGVRLVRLVRTPDGRWDEMRSIFR
jgi:hypothetical protein